MIVVHAILRTKPAHRDETVAALIAMREATVVSDGCLHYEYNASLTDPNEFTCVEEWRDLTALRTHIASDHMARLEAVLERTAAGKETIRVFDAIPTGL